jgi:tetratricopeptide (TPR) repeat protein
VIAQSNVSDPMESSLNQKADIGLEPLEEVPNVTIEALQTKEIGVNSPPKNHGASQLVENTPQNSIDWNELGNSYAKSKKIDNAIEAYKRAIEMNPKYGQPYCNLGLTYYRLGKYDLAVLLYKKSIELLDVQEDRAVSWNRLGDAYRRLGDYGNALAAYQKASELAPAVSTVMARARATLVENIIVG